MFDRICKITANENLLKCNAGYLKIAEYLIGKGADIEAKNYQGETALHSSSAVGNWKEKS